MGNSTAPSELDGLIFADLSKRVAAQKKISNWLTTLKPKSRLAEIQEIFSSLLQQEAAPFQSWIYNKHLESTLGALRPMMDRGSHGRGSVNYRNKVRDLLSERTDTILALCGRKFEAQRDNEDYFKEFYEFAKRRKDMSEHKDGIYVCRIFVEVEEERLTPFMDDEFKRHEENRHNGVLGLTIKAHKRRQLDSY